MERPRSIEIAAALVALQAFALAAWGIGELIRSVTGHPHDRGTAVLLGVVVLVYGCGVGLAARGVWRMRRWAQTPSLMVSFFAIVIGVGQLHTLAIVAVPLLVIGAASFVALFQRDCRDSLGGI